MPRIRRVCGWMRCPIMPMKKRKRRSRSKSLETLNSFAGSVYPSRQFLTYNRSSNTSLPIPPLPLIGRLGPYDVANLSPFQSLSSPPSVPHASRPVSSRRHTTTQKPILKPIPKTPIANNVQRAVLWAIHPTPNLFPSTSAGTCLTHTYAHPPEARVRLTLTSLLATSLR